ncbi:hypothetical protein [Mycobacterium szulgai]|uniref:Uncharacterized protein n=1 Tax=Mycobacterium szulgai TaxID=1787 RepID=A0A1X2DKS4_MYCSZ|nr:hypothetical protein [Mycobacterium szulgai]MCV7076988.1 hypothetical protein [Mycobacterium szulgai]ORW88792.1 hypothetical protein AWC27_13920 [Mycobacterium szulgai]
MTTTRVSVRPLHHLGAVRLVLDDPPLTWTMTGDQACELAEQLIDAAERAIPHQDRETRR